MSKKMGLLAAFAILFGMFFLLVIPLGRRSSPNDENGKPVLTVEDPVVVCYAALDEEFSRPILTQFETHTGIIVEMVFDAESTKTIGLVNRLIAEKGRPRCDVFWNNEIMNTVRLKRKGLLAEFRPKAAAGFPQGFQDPGGRWTGFAARARVLIVNTELVKKEDLPQRLRDLFKPEWKGKIGIAKPFFGSTATWVTVLQAQHQAKIAKEGYRDEVGFSQLDTLTRLVKEQELRILGGNKTCARTVASGGLAMAFTDTDDAIIEKESGKPVTIVFLDGGAEDEGTLFYPNTLALIKNCPHPNNGKRLIEFLLSKDVEIALANSRSAQIPVNPAIKAGVDFKPRVATPATIKPLVVDWDKVADVFDESMRWVEKNFGK